MFDKRIGIFTAAALLALTGGLPRPAQAQPEQIWALESGYNGDIAVAADGTVWVASVDRWLDGLRVDRRAPDGAWTSELVDTFLEVGAEWASLALDAQDRPTVVFSARDSNAEPRQFRLAERNAGAWTVSPVDLTPVNYRGRIEFDGDGERHLLLAGGARYIEYRGPETSGQVLASPYGCVDIWGLQTPGLLRPRILFEDNGNNIMFGQWNGTSWGLLDLTGPDEWSYPCLATGADGTSWVVYYIHNGTEWEIRARSSLTGWGSDELVYLSQEPFGPRLDPTYMGAAIGPDGQPRVAFVTGGCGENCFGDAVVIAKRQAGAWTVETVDGPDDDRSPGYRLAYAVDAAGTDHIAYRESNTGRHVYLRRESSGAASVEELPGAGAPRIASVAPNPFNPRTEIAFVAAGPGRVTVEILDLRGRRVRTVLDAALPGGSHTVTWNGADDAGRGVGAGTYLVRVRDDAGSAVRKVQLLK